MNENKFNNTVELNVEYDDHDLINVSKTFINDAEINFIKFKCEYKNQETKLKKYLQNPNFSFTPEKLSKKSPLTLIDAPWGSGKTYFIENLLKLFIDEKIKSDIFKKIIIIDAWKFSNSKDVPFEFSFEIANRIVGLQAIDCDKQTKEKFLKKIIRKMIPNSFSMQINVPFVSVGCEWLPEQNSEKLNDEEERKWQLIDNNPDATIIFIDNLERLGSHSWDLLKAILKIQEYANYLIVLPLNLKKLKNNEPTEKNAEYPIEKYVDFNYYSFKQDYLNFIRSKIQKEKLANIINKILNKPIDETNLSIREVENAFNQKDFFKEDDDYKVILKIKNEVWNPININEDFFIEDVKCFIENEKSKMDIIREIQTQLIEERLNIKLIMSEEENLYSKFWSNLVDWESKKMFFYVLNQDYTKDIELAESITLKRKKIKKLNSNILNYEDLKNIDKTIEKLKNAGQGLSYFNNLCHLTQFQKNYILQKLEKHFPDFNEGFNNHKDFDLTSLKFD